MFGLGSSQFARRYYGNRLLLSIPSGTKMVQFPEFPPPKLCIHFGVIRLFSVTGSPIRTSTDLSLLTAPRSLSQLATSLFGFRHQGIRRAPFTIYSYLNTRSFFNNRIFSFLIQLTLCVNFKKTLNWMFFHRILFSIIFDEISPPRRGRKTNISP